MCGRFVITTDPARLAEDIDAVNEMGAAGIRPPNYNVAPTDDVVAVVARHQHSAEAEADGPVTRRVRPMRWGLRTSWSKPKGPQLINARAETVTTLPAYRTAARYKRCLVPMDGYYEWKPNPDNPKRGRKTPFYFFRPDGEPLFVAGLWSVWRPEPDADPQLSCTVITTEAAAQFAHVHDRMPLALGRQDWDRWLDPDSPAPVDLLSGAPHVDELEIREVSALVSSVSNNGPELIAPVDPGDQPVGLF